MPGGGGKTGIDSEAPWREVWLNGQQVFSQVGA